MYAIRSYYAQREGAGRFRRDGDARGERAVVRGNVGPPGFEGRFAACRAVGFAACFAADRRTPGSVDRERNPRRAAPQGVGP